MSDSCCPKQMSRTVGNGKGGGPGSGPAAWNDVKKVDSSKPGKEVTWKGSKYPDNSARDIASGFNLTPL